ncbi:MAG: hypothetical protein KC620_11340 [Myxococcales bacterium]|nr:hypothetical protein [Myxococcales bacterium]
MRASALLMFFGCDPDAAPSYGPDAAEGARCAEDVDCRGVLLCQNGRCTAPPDVALPPTEAFDRGPPGDQDTRGCDPSGIGMLCDACGADGGLIGQTVCEGGEIVCQCSNRCGGAAPLADQPGDPCGPCQHAETPAAMDDFDHFRCDGADAVVCHVRPLTACGGCAADFALAAEVIAEDAPPAPGMPCRIAAPDDGLTRCGALTCAPGGNTLACMADRYINPCERCVADPCPAPCHRDEAADRCACPACGSPCEGGDGAVGQWACTADRSTMLCVAFPPDSEACP